jgi:lipopolysaccharide export system permease protein
VIARYRVEWHKKFSLSFAVLVLFFIGAPLGAIIRKGGIGLPVVVSVCIFIVYHTMSFSMEKMGRELVWTPAQSMWTASFILLPIGIFLTYKAATDSALLNMEAYLKPLENLKEWLARRGKKSD